MRISWTLTALLVASLLAGCTSSSDGPEAPSGEANVPGDSPYLPSGSLSDMPRLRFDAPEFEQEQSFNGAFPNPDTCIFPVACEPPVLRFDLTPMIPAGAPVELAATIKTDDCIFADLEVAEAAIYRMSSDDESLAATLVREAAGTVTMVIQHGPFCAGIDPTGSSKPVDVQVRTVVRGDVMPPYMPAVLKLAPGDRILAMGEGAADVDDLIVIPPGQAAIHHLDEPSFNVTPDMPAGDYIVMVVGGDAMLHGPNVTLRPARFLHMLGEDRPLTSGQPLTWTTPVPGIPAFAVLYVMTGTSGGVDNARVSYDSGFTMAIRQNGAELVADDRPSCAPVPGAPCNMNGPGGQATRTIGTGLFPEGLGLGDLEFEVTNEASQGMHAYELIGYIAV